MAGAKDYADGEEDLLLLLGLEELYEIQDVSLAKDKSMMKKQIKDEKMDWGIVVTYPQLKGDFHDD